MLLPGGPLPAAGVEHTSCKSHIRYAQCIEIGRLDADMQVIEKEFNGDFYLIHGGSKTRIFDLSDFNITPLLTTS